MNIALPALIVFLLLLPGFLFRYSYKRTEKTLLDFKPFGETTLKSIFAAFIIDATWALLAPRWSGYQIDFGNLLAFLSGAAQPDAFRAAVRQASENAWPIYLFFLLLFMGSWSAGRAARKTIELLRLDQRDKTFAETFRFDTPWFYLFNGYDEDEPPDGVYIAAVVDMDGGPYLYVGILQEYFFTENGELDRLVLSDVVRRKLSQDKIENPKDEDTDLGSTGHERFYPIAGDYFVLKYSEIHTLNIRYVRLVQAEEVKPPPDATPGI